MPSDDRHNVTPAKQHGDCADNQRRPDKPHKDLGRMNRPITKSTNPESRQMQRRLNSPRLERERIIGRALDKQDIRRRVKQ
jgi:hypothetical protein